MILFIITKLLQYYTILFYYYKITIGLDDFFSGSNSKHFILYFIKYLKYK